MKKNLKLIKQLTIICLILMCGQTLAQDTNPCRTGGQTCYFGVEINGVLCGYSVETCCEGMLNGNKIRYENSNVILKMSVLGADVNGGFSYNYALDPVTGKAQKIEVSVINGESVVSFITKLRNDTAFYSVLTSGVSKSIHLGSDVICSSQTRYPHLFSDFIKNGVTEKKYKVYDPIKGEITEKEYVWKSEEKLQLSDSLFQTVVLEETDLSTGVKTNLWITKTDGFNVKVEVAGRHIFLTDKSVINKINFADLDKELFAKVGKIIPDFINLSWMKVKTMINSFGENLSVEALNNIPGQKFIGTVKGSYIDGIFEIEPTRYTGKNAPSFPPDFSNGPGLKKYIEPESLIESHDPLIISKALEITKGSGDSWEAAVRLSKWVAENIAGELPGGISAINTLKTQGAECGGHSRLLAAFCRAVGIPARVVVGCMFTNHYSGSFGQHAWTEVYMGDNGWIPVDATIRETDYIDAGHIRLGQNVTFRPVRMEVLDFRTEMKSTEISLPMPFGNMLGSYMNVEQYRMFRIIDKNGGLAMDIPGRAILDLNPPDDRGRWFPELTQEISITPLNKADGNIEKMIVHQYFRLRKISVPESGMDLMPEEFRELTGNYQFAPANLSIDVTFSNGLMSTKDATGKSSEMRCYIKKGEKWIDETGVNEIEFISNSNNEVIGIILSAGTEFRRGEPVTNAVEQVLKDSGIEAGLNKYDEIKMSGNNEYLFSEQMLHQLGHSLLKENRIDEAIKVFKKNVQEYPDSFMAHDALAETYLMAGNSNMAVKYFESAVKIDPDYEYGRNKIEELKKN